MSQQVLPAPTVRVRPVRRRLGRDRAKWVFLLPAVVWVLAFTIFPVGYAVRTSLYHYRSGRLIRYIGFDNFRRLWDDEFVRQDLRTTFEFVVSAVVVEMVLGVALALLFNREMRARGLFRTFMTLPLFATPVAIGYLGITLFYEAEDRHGPINALITTLGGSAPSWLADPFWAKAAVVLTDVWQWTPFVFLVTLSGLQGLPQDILEAARVDGASWWQVLRSITLPLMAPLLWLVLLLRAIDAFKAVEIVASMTLGGPGNATELYGRLVYLTARQESRFGYAAAQGFLLLFIVMLLVSLLWGRIRRIYDEPR